MASLTKTIDVNQVMRESVEFKIELVGLTRWGIKVKIAMFLIRLACLVMGTGVEFVRSDNDA